MRLNNHKKSQKTYIMTQNKLTRIGIFYDGNYFLHVSNYYNYQHQRKARISVSGLHEFIRHQVALEEDIEPRLCHIVDAHYFRGRLSASEAQTQNKLYADRVFDDILMNEGVITHYLPLRNRGGFKSEKGIDVWLALEAFELAIHKKFDVIAMVASDGDYVPLIKKLNTLGTRVMLLSWDFEFTDDNNNLKSTRTSMELLQEVTYPIAMHEMIDNRIKSNQSLINDIFVKVSEMSEAKKLLYRTTSEERKIDFSELNIDPELIERSTIKSLKNGFGFINYPQNNLFFFHTDMIEGEFTELMEGDMVEFVKEVNDDKQVAKFVRRVKEELN